MTNFDALMEMVCVGWGYCGSIQNDQPVNIHHFIPESGSVTADQFVEWIFAADNMRDKFSSPDGQSHRKALREIFIEHMGSDVVDANQLRYEV